jgi:hypothetical protein
MTTHYCVFKGTHVYYSTNERKVEAFRDKHAPGQELTQTQYPQTYGITHRL